MKLTTLAAAAVLALTAGSAGAATFTYSTDFDAGVGAEWTNTAGYNNGDAGILGQLDGGVATLKQTNANGAGSGTISFDVLGFRSIDGYNCCTDTFTLAVNGTQIFWGVFALAGGGTEGWTPTATVTGSGSTRRVTVAFNALAGLNTFDFSYGALQGYGDEAWGLDNVSFNATVADLNGGGGVPEPSAWALMILGFGAAGSALRRRRVVAA